MARLIAVAIALAAFCVAGGRVYAADTTLGYEQRVARAIEEVKRIKKDEIYARDGAATIRTLLPRYEEVDFEGRTIMVDNNWLYPLLDAYEKSSAYSDRSEKLDAIAERLGAIHEDILKVINHSKEQRQVDAEKDKSAVRSILDRAEFKPRPEDPVTSFISHVKTRVTDFLLEIWKKISRSAFRAVGGQVWIFPVIALLLLGSIIGFALKSIAKYRTGRPAREKRTILGEEIAEGVSARDLAGAGIEAAKAGDFRLAIRKLYVALLYQLAENGLIELELNATNRDYLRMLSRYTLVSGPLVYLTDKFDYFWYGKFPASRNDFDQYFAIYGKASEQAKAATANPARVSGTA